MTTQDAGPQREPDERVREALAGLDWVWEKLQRMGEDASDLAFKRDMAHGTRSVAKAIAALRRLQAREAVYEERLASMAGTIAEPARP